MSTASSQHVKKPAGRRTAAIAGACLLAATGAGAHMPVGQLRPNGFGLHDMHGNVAEWVEDVYDLAFYSRPEATGPDPVSNADPAGHFRDDGPADRVQRGGGTEDPRFCRSASRAWNMPGVAGADVGFRPAFNLR
jgi:formylglycine-generating enzyme required for sulfatase activity